MAKWAMTEIASDASKVFLLFMCITHSTISIALQAAGDNESLAIAATVAFSIFAVAAIICMCYCPCCMALSQNYDEESFSSVCSVNFIVIVGGVLFFVGDDLPPILTTYREKLSCDQTCVDVIRSTRRFLLLAALVCFDVIAPLCRLLMKSSDSESESNLAASLLHLLGYAIEFDDIYTAVWDGSIQQGATCSLSDAIASWISFGLLWFACLILVSTYFLVALDSSNNNRPGFTLCAILLILLTIGMYLLGDNYAPIGCFCNNSTTAGGFNTTVAITSCSELTGKIIRLGFMGGSIFFGSITLGLIGIMFCREQKDTNRYTTIN